MSNETLRGLCPAPFYDRSFFSESGGYLDGRFCAPPTAPGGPSCCLPCPATAWIYPDSFDGYSKAAAWLNIVGFIVLSFLLISYAILPAQMTNKHYLNVCLVVSCVLLNLGFIVPYAADADQCYDEVTSNDMYSDNACAFSGSFILLGGLSAAFWVCLRALSMFLQIVWGIEPGKKSFYFYQAVGWGMPAVLVTSALVVTGVSYRFGGACHINHEHAMVDFWGWVMAVAGITIVIQVCTIVYCLKVYLSNLFASDSEDEEDDVPDLTPTSFDEKAGMSPTSATAEDHEIVPQKVTAKEIYAQVKTVLYVQWRILFLTVTMLIEVVFFSVVFVLLDTATTDVHNDYRKAQSWLTCLVLAGGDKNQCLKETNSWMVNYNAVSGVLIMLSIIGLCVFCLLFRTSIISGWRDWINQNIIRRTTSFRRGNDKPFIAPPIRHLGVISTSSDRMLSPGPFSPGSAANTPLTAPNATVLRTGHSPTDPTITSPTKSATADPEKSGFYDVSSYRTRAPSDQPGPGRYWHPNPHVQAAQREGIMRTLRMARARAQNAIQGTSQNRYASTTTQRAASPLAPSPVPGAILVTQERSAMAHELPEKSEI